MKWRQGPSQRGSLACDKAGQESPSPLVLTSPYPGVGEGVHAPSLMDIEVGDYRDTLQGHKGTLLLWCLCGDSGQGWPDWTALVPI